MGGTVQLDGGKDCNRWGRLWYHKDPYTENRHKKKQTNFFPNHKYNQTIISMHTLQLLQKGRVGPIGTAQLSQSRGWLVRIPAESSQSRTDVMRDAT